MFLISVCWQYFLIHDKKRNPKSPLKKTSLQENSKINLQKIRWALTNLLKLAALNVYVFSTFTFFNPDNKIKPEYETLKDLFYEMDPENFYMFFQK